MQLTVNHMQHAGGTDAGGPGYGAMQNMQAQQSYDAGGNGVLFPTTLPKTMPSTYCFSTTALHTTVAYWRNRMSVENACARAGIVKDNL